MLQKKFIGVSATKSWENSRIFRYGLPEDFLSNGQKTKGGGHGIEGLQNYLLKEVNHIWPIYIYGSYRDTIFGNKLIKLKFCSSDLQKALD